MRRARRGPPCDGGGAEATASGGETEETSAESDDRASPSEEPEDAEFQTLTPGTWPSARCHKQVDLPVRPGTLGWIYWQTYWQIYW